MTNVKGETATIRPPKGTRHVLVRTFSKANFGAFTVKITPHPASGPAERSYLASDTPLTVLPLLLADLDPKRQYEIAITNDGDGEVGFLSAIFTKRAVDNNCVASQTDSTGRTARMSRLSSLQ